MDANIEESSQTTQFEALPLPLQQRIMLEAFNAQAVAVNKDWARVLRDAWQNDDALRAWALPAGQQARAALWDAVQRGRAGTLALILDKGWVETAADRHVMGTALFTAIHCDQASVVKLLLDRQAGENWHGGRQGETPAHEAARKGRTAALAALLARGADVGSRDRNGYTPTHLAAEGGHTAALEVLLAAGADAGARDKCGRTPAHEAARKGHTEALAALLAGGADVGAKADDGDTPLHPAAREGHAKAARTLLAAGANVGAKSNFGKTPAHLAAENGRTAVLAALLAAGADLGTKDDGGDTPLHEAARFGQVEAARALLAAGADAQLKNEAGKIPRDLACSEEVAALLAPAGKQRARGKRGVAPLPP